MSSDYVSLIPINPDYVPTDEAVARGLQHLAATDVLRRAGDGWTTGANLQLLVQDPKPFAKNGQVIIAQPGAPVWYRSYAYIRGHAGINFEPIACSICQAELPFDEMLAALGAATGDVALSRDALSIGCIHCDGKNYGPEHDYGISGGFARFELHIEVTTSRQTQGNPAVLQEMTAILGAPIKMVQVLA